MDGYEDVGITGIGGLADFFQAIGLEQLGFYSGRIQIACGRFTYSQSHITFTQARFTVDGSRVWMPVRRMAGVQEYFHCFSSPF